MENMSIHELQFVIPEELYFFKEDLDSSTPVSKVTPLPAANPAPKVEIETQPLPEPIPLRGSFTKGILIIHEEEDLRDEVMEMLVNLIKAIGHSMTEVGLVSSKILEGRSLEELYALNAQKVLKFGRIKHPINAMPASDYYIHMEGETEYLFADALSTIAEDRALKGKLWKILQVLFNISKK